MFRLVVPAGARRGIWRVRRGWRALLERPLLGRRLSKAIGLPACDVVIAVGNMHVGGAERVAVTVAKSITATGRRVWFVVMEDPRSTPWSTHFAEASSGVLLLPTLCNRLNSERVLAMFVRRTRPTHLILSNTYAAYRALPRIRERCADLTIVDVLHGEGSVQYTSPAEYSKPYRQLIDRRVAVSQHVKQVLVDRGGEDPVRVAVIQNSVDVSRFEPDGGYREVSTPEDELVVVFFGRLSPEKRPGVVIHLAQEMARRGQSRVRFVIAGRGPLAGQLAQGIEDSGVNSVTLKEGSTEAADVLRGADVLVLPSTTEGFGLVLLEAMAARVLPIATRVGGTPEVIDHGRTGLLVENDDDPSVVAAGFAAALEDLLAKPSWLASMRADARQSVDDRFSEDRMIRAYHRLLGFAGSSRLRGE